MKSTLVLFIFVKVAGVVVFLIFWVGVEIWLVVPNFFENGV